MQSQYSCTNLTALTRKQNVISSHFPNHSSIFEMQCLINTPWPWGSKFCPRRRPARGVWDALWPAKKCYITIVDALYVTSESEAKWDRGMLRGDWKFWARNAPQGISGLITGLVTHLATVRGKANELESDAFLWIMQSDNCMGWISARYLCDEYGVTFDLAAQWPTWLVSQSLVLDTVFMYVWVFGGWASGLLDSYA